MRELALSELEKVSGGSGGYDPRPWILDDGRSYNSDPFSVSAHPDGGVQAHFSSSDGNGVMTVYFPNGGLSSSGGDFYVSGVDGDMSWEDCMAAGIGDAIISGMAGGAAIGTISGALGGSIAGPIGWAGGGLVGGVVGSITGIFGGMIGQAVICTY